MELNRRRYLTAVGTTASALALAGCSESDSGDSSGGNVDNSNSGNGNSSGGGSNSGNGNSGNSDGGDQPDVEILNDEFYEEQFQAGVRGTAVNNTDSELSYVEATATFLDSEGTQIGEGLDNVSDLAAGREWEFDCLYTGQDPERVDSYEVEVTTGF
jgi:hypothetical protein